ncbi:MAG: hypothetical protein DMD67_13730 [Gemmatimonadetes bacterium]|nr:MAG: hypothetical protein DMD67_13730 [Gemmatimonadota bacterium]
MDPLARVRWRLTAWYVGILLSILGILGGGLYVAVRHRMSQQLDASLRSATAALIHAARIREAEQASPKGVVADAVDELHIPDRSLYLFTAGATPVRPLAAPEWIREAAREAERSGTADRDFETPEDHIVRLADRLELEDEYASLIRAFIAAALIALVLVAGGGYVLVRQATAPIARTMERMRRFMADAAHELRAPVTILRTRADVAASQARDPARDAATLDAIEREAARIGEIVGELLTLARADAGERPVAREVLYLDDAAAGAVDGIRAVAGQKGVHLEVGAFEEAKVTGDPALIRQLLLIVLDNAVKFTPKGGRVEIAVSAHDGQGALVVSDTGIGIPADQLPHVFERFYRGDPARHEADGAGLGLAIAQWIADSHGARIAIDSQPGAGTRVTLTFPLAA